MANIHKLEELCREMIATIYDERHNERMRVDGYWDDMTARMESENKELLSRLDAALAENAPDVTGGAG